MKKFCPEILEPRIQVLLGKKEFTFILDTTFLQGEYNEDQNDDEFYKKCKATDLEKRNKFTSLNNSFDDEEETQAKFNERYRKNKVHGFITKVRAQTARDLHCLYFYEKSFVSFLSIPVQQKELDTIAEEKEEEQKIEITKSVLNRSFTNDLSLNGSEKGARKNGRAKKIRKMSQLQMEMKIIKTVRERIRMKKKLKYAQMMKLIVYLASVILFVCQIGEFWYKNKESEILMEMIGQQINLDLRTINLLKISHRARVIELQAK
jgi:hypothetical protein